MHIFYRLHYEWEALALGTLCPRHIGRSVRSEIVIVTVGDMSCLGKWDEIRLDIDRCVGGRLGPGQCSVEDFDLSHHWRFPRSIYRCLITFHPRLYHEQQLWLMSETSQ